MLQVQMYLYKNSDCIFLRFYKKNKKLSTVFRKLSTFTLTIMPIYPKGDRHNATFRHEFYQDDRENPFVGYSKFIGHNEAKNKEELLESYISRMLRNGYLESSYTMDFFTNNKYGNNTDLLLVSINQNGYALMHGAELYSSLDFFLKNYFIARKNPNFKEQVQVQASRKRMGFEAKVWYNFEKKFKDKQELIDHIKVIIEKFGEDQRTRCTGFYWKVIELQDLK